MQHWAEIGCYPYSLVLVSALILMKYVELEKLKKKKQSTGYFNKWRSYPYQTNEHIVEWLVIATPRKLWSNRTRGYKRLIHPSRHLPAQIHQCKHQNSVWNLFKGNNYDTRRRDIMTTPSAYSLLKLSEFKKINFYFSWNQRLSDNFKGNRS